MTSTDDEPLALRTIFVDSQRLSFVINGSLLVLSLGIVAAMAFLGTDFAIQSKGNLGALGRAYVALGVLVTFVPGFFFRNIGGLASLFAGSFLAGSTMVTCFHQLNRGTDFSVSFLQILLSVFVVIGVLVWLLRLDIDFENVDVTDLMR